MSQSYQEQRSVFFDDTTFAKGHWHPRNLGDPIEKRDQTKSKLALIFRLFGKLGFGEGIAGHLSVRDPIEADCFWVNPVGRDFGSIQAHDLVRVNKEGDVLDGQLPINKSAFSIHSVIHGARSNVHAVVHAHTRYGKTWASLGRLLDPINQDACVFFEDHAVHNAFDGVVNNTGASSKIVDSLANNKALILQNHGLLTVGETIEEAAWWFVIMERSCEVQLLAEAVGAPVPLPAEVARRTRQQIGSSYCGWLSIQPLLEAMKDQNDHAS